MAIFNSYVSLPEGIHLMRSKPPCRGVYPKISQTIPSHGRFIYGMEFTVNYDPILTNKGQIGYVY